VTGSCTIICVILRDFLKIFTLCLLYIYHAPSICDISVFVCDFGLYICVLSVESQELKIDI